MESVGHPPIAYLRRGTKASTCDVGPQIGVQSNTSGSKVMEFLVSAQKDTSNFADVDRSDPKIAPQIVPSKRRFKQRQHVVCEEARKRVSDIHGSTSLLMAKVSSIVLPQHTTAARCKPVVGHDWSVGPLWQWSLTPRTWGLDVAAALDTVSWTCLSIHRVRVQKNPKADRHLADCSSQADILKDEKLNVED